MKTIGILSLSCAIALTTSLAIAQAPAGAKQRGEYSFYGGAAGSAMRSARDYSNYYQQYARSAPAVNREVTKETADAVGDYITKSEKHLAWMRKEAKNSNDKETLTSLDAIDKHLADAKKHHANLCEYCEKENVAAKESMQCCQEIDTSLAKAIAEHDKLMKRLAPKK